jgi:hypothetical protein
MACHGAEGISPSPDTPNLAGQNSGYLAAQLSAFKSGARRNDLMAAIAAQLSEADMASLAAYWSRLPTGAPAAQAEPPAVRAIRPRMSFPSNFPAGFTAYQSIQGDGFVTRRFANAIAMRAAREGKALPDGSVIFQVTYATAQDASGAVAPGAVKSYAGMESRAGWGAEIPSLLRNENWDFATFGPDRVRRDNQNEAPCLACHKPQAADSYVFSMKMMQAAARQGPRSPK